MCPRSFDLALSHLDVGQQGQLSFMGFRPWLTSWLSCLEHHVEGLRSWLHPVPWTPMASLPVPHQQGPGDQAQGTIPTCSWKKSHVLCSPGRSQLHLPFTHWALDTKPLLSDPPAGQLPPASEPLHMLFHLLGSLFSRLASAPLPVFCLQADCSQEPGLCSCLSPLGPL